MTVYGFGVAFLMDNSVPRVFSFSRQETQTGIDAPDAYEKRERLTNQSQLPFFFVWSSVPTPSLWEKGALKRAMFLDISFYDIDDHRGDFVWVCIGGRPTVFEPAFPTVFGYGNRNPD